ncbi:hypothetical protein GCM10010915_17210 [Microbacterium faecale]|uniref:Uncharacterized protein n=1 Tax=Microbacterium faecale TaxID=1804630 RepID=A0A917DHD4_9MICO|nr:hypothetical protein [Microbacterium faecale]GGD37007.1 hypothetical protein GCM10010915_17210 [Microbacterium faecale]
MMAAVGAGFAAIGAGLILCAVGAGAGVPAAIGLVALALAEFAWAVATMHTRRVLAPRSALAASVAIVAGATLLLFTARIGLAPFLALLALHGAVGIAAAVVLRRRARDQPISATDSRMPLVAVIVVQAMAVAAVTTPALADTEPGDMAVPHGTHHEH